MDSAPARRSPGFFDGGGRHGRPGKRRVLLREPEVCAECNRVFISLWAIRSCVEHQGLEEI